MAANPLPPPFITIEGIINARSVGGYSDPPTKPNLLYRCADPSRITPTGKIQLQALGISDVFDFRADDEIASYNTPAPDVAGITFHRVPVSEKRAFDPISLAARMEEFANDERGTFVRLNNEILESAGPAFQTVLRHMLDNPDKPCMVHCTIGKDRTGIFTALLLMLLGVPDKDIAAEYGLTSAALEPYAPLLIERFKQRVGNVEHDNWEGLSQMISSKPENMEAILQMVREKYGGAEGWVTTHTSLTSSDVELLRQNSR
ncbi:TYR-PHOSPHATASE-2 domain-containing protein [Mycena indigotica]|uniref:TYR-PHOSPHATASE-2 domain-containing protein n=1 Tax=Mycena indigotica TaxID=2126181 RepID=A0A8H6RYD6_9AGAR|nr:TYR-PHOSPHATASE-2 domain-containing protein [Mycena indigotica]KAF7289236.1 TYR-PHOSPHATASE-2 domain-containing protein [Mycena indigotica]